MSPAQVIQLGRELLITAILLSLPAVAVSLIVGTLISILQTVTNIQEQTLSFAPRILAVGIALIVCLPWMLNVAGNFTLRVFQMIVEAGP